MAQYITRVQLEDAETEPIYDILYDAMKVRGFAKVIPAEDGNLYSLPRAEYYISTPLPIDTVLNSAQAAANSTGKHSMILVTEVLNIEWNNLEPFTGS